MKTEILIGGRMTGKTTKAIKKSNETGARILVANHSQVKFVLDLAKDLKIKIKKPITPEYLMNSGMKGTSYRNSVIKDGIIIDEGKLVLSSILRAPIRMITISDRDAADAHGK